MREALALCSLDGRVTAGHFSLLRALHEEGRLQQLILFQTGGIDWSARDEAMAQLLLREWDRNGPVLIVAGNLHTKLQPHSHGVPLGHHIASAAAATEVRLDFARGCLYNGRRIIKIPARRADHDLPSIEPTTDGSVQIVLAEAHPAVVARLVTG